MSVYVCDLFFLHLFCVDGENDFALSIRVTVFVFRQSYWPRLLPTPVFLFPSTPELYFLGVSFFAGFDEMSTPQ